MEEKTKNEMHRNRRGSGDGDQRISSHANSNSTLRTSNLSGALYPGPPDPAVAVRVLVQVLLVVVLGVVELRRFPDFRGHRAEAVCTEGPLVLVAGAFGRHLLRVRIRIDGGPVLRSNISALAHALGGIVVFPERL